jgi:adenylate cyclase
VTAIAACRTCGTEPLENARFCHGCGAPVAEADTRAEYKQVTVLFADVVHSMDIAAAVGAERLREIMAELVDRATAVVKRYGGTVDKFTGDGIMAIFGAPVALEDHAVRACLGALGVQEEAKRLAVDVRERDGVDLGLRVGLNSGQVIAGDIGSGPFGYTAMGEHVGMAQRMESVASPGAVMLSESTARLVENSTVLGETEMVHIKGSTDSVGARRLVAVAGRGGRTGQAVASLVGREWELAALAGMLDRAISGHGCVAGVVGPAGIGKSRIVAETAAIAARRGVQMFEAYCESHATEVPFYTVARLLRAAFGVEGLDDHEAARGVVRAQVPAADLADLVLLDDMLGIRDPAVDLPDIAPDAWRRRLTALVNAAALARETPGVYVIEDAHWIDQVSESLLADLLSVVSRTHSLVLITYRPEYRGALSRTPGAQTIALAPLDDTQTAALITELLGSHSSVAGLADRITEQAGGNPFFAQEIVRDLADRGVLSGPRGAYVCQGQVDEVSVPATLQAAIAARIDRLGPDHKATLYAAAVIGTRFDADMLGAVVDNADVAALIEAELVEQVRFTPRAEYAFGHPLIRSVAYESQLKSDRAQLHRRLVAAIEARDPTSAEENAALIAEHLEAAGDLHAAFGWHMRAGTWATNRDIAAARTSWRRALRVADQVPDDDADRLSMRIAPRTLLCATAFRVGGSGAETGFEELRDLCRAADDQRSLAIGMSGLVISQMTKARRPEASRLATELVRLLESIDDPTLTVALLWMAMTAKHETGEMAEVLRLAQLAIDLGEGDLTKGNLVFGSPVTLAIAMRGAARSCFGIAGWRDDLRQATETAYGLDPVTLAAVVFYAYIIVILYGILLPDATVLRYTAEALAMAEQSGDDTALYATRTARGLSLIHHDGAACKAGLDLLRDMRETALDGRFSLTIPPIVDIQTASEKARLGDLDGAIALARTVVDDLLSSGGCIWSALATAVLVEALVQRGGDGDLKDAQGAIDRLAAVPNDPGFVLHEIWLLRLRALLAQAHGDAAAYADFRDRYRDMARTLGFEGHIAMAEAMT